MIDFLFSRKQIKVTLSITLVLCNTIQFKGGVNDKTKLRWLNTGVSIFILNP